MDEKDTILCTNCKREIPVVNFTTHSVHCARNLRTCPVCKEPVPVAQLAEHHDALHKEVPCKECGESVCGTDLEDHIRDSCAQTIKPCRYCELELPRRALPAHEAYCGARSEQCRECREYVMAKYRQLHLDSNHGFVRLDEDPVPAPKPTPKVPNGLPVAAPGRSADVSYSDNRLAEASRRSNGVSAPEASRSNGVRVTAKRNNDQPQINTDVEPVEKVTKQLPSRGAVKKRHAPPPPPPDARRDAAYVSASRRLQLEEERRQQQTAYNLSVGRVWQPADVPTSHVLGHLDSGPSGVGDLGRLQPMSAAQFMDRFQRLQLAPRADRFGEIKASLRDLRRELGEVTAPYNSANSNNDHVDSSRPRAPSPDERLPCEFCGAPVPADELVLHQTGCRPDLARRRPRRSPEPREEPPQPPQPQPPQPPQPREEAVIPCEFCTEALPVYLISEHQERCSREGNLLYPD